MSGVKDINELLSSMQPELIDESFVFCTVTGQLAEYLNLEPIATFVEPEGLTLVLTKDKADEAGLNNEFYNDLSTSLNQALAIAKGEAEPSRKFSHEMPDIKSIRTKTGLSQQQFADKLNISPRTLQNWEQGTRNPTGVAVTLMRLFDRQPNLTVEA